MRISDWSSDVCSSDLCGARRGPDAREMVESDLIVVWGGNPVNTQVNVMTWVAKARKARGAKLVVVDPYRTGTAEQADVHLAPKPGTDGALAAAMISVLLAEGYADRAYMEKRSEEHTSELQSLMRISYAVFC